MTGLSLYKAVKSNAPVLRVTWNTPQSNVTISQYNVQYRKIGATFWSSELAIPGSPPAAYAILTGLNAGTEYNVRVRAVSAVGDGNWSEEQSERTYMRESFSYTNSVSSG